MKISEVQPIEESGYITMPSREELAGLVEMPILNACQMLWDKNIITGMSSANRKDVGRFAYIDLPVEYLSDENIGVLASIDGVEEVRDQAFQESLKVYYPVKEDTTVEEVKEHFESIANMLMMQDIFYGVCPLDSARELYQGYVGCPPEENMTDEEIAEALGRFVQEGIIYDSEEVYKRHLRYLEQKGHEYQPKI